MRPSLVSRLVLAVAAFARFSAAQTPAPDEPAANPGRPTVSTPATLTPLAYVQFETGVLAATDFEDLVARVGFNEVAKITVQRRTQLFAQFEPYVRGRERGEPATKTAGGTGAGLQFVVIDGGERKPTLSASYSHSVTDGSAPDLDIGSAKESLLFLLSTNLSGFHFDTNAIFSQQTTDTGRSVLQTGETLSGSRAVGEITIAGEIWHFTQPVQHGHAAGLLWAASYPPRPNLVLDVGFEHGLTDSSTRWEFFAGFTYLLPHRLWRAK